jgi:hypothetical protein
MPSLREMVYDIKNIAYGGVQSDDNRISDLQVAYWIRQTRAVLVNQQLANRSKIDTSLIQHLNYVEFEQVDPAGITGLDSGYKVMKSTKPIPQTIQRFGKNTIIAVESLDGSTGYSETNYFRRKYNKYNKYTGLEARWYIQEGYMYLINNFLVDKLRVSGIFENPEEAVNFKINTGEASFSWDENYPVTSVMANAITSIVLQQKMGVTRQMPNDETNDGDDTQNPPAQQAPNKK